MGMKSDGSTLLFAIEFAITGIVFRVASLFFYRLILCLRDDMRTKIEIRAKKDYLFRLILYCEQEQGYSGIHSRGQ